MANRTWPARASSLAALLSLLAAMLLLTAGVAAADVTCPTVDPGTGAVTPLPEPLTDWSGCDLSGANLASAPMSKDNLSGANLTGANLDGADVDTADFTSADLHDASLTSADLDSATLTDADLSAGDLNGAYLNYAVLTGANIGGANLGGISVTAITTGGLTGGFPSLMPANYSLYNGYLVGPQVILNGADLSGLNLNNLDLYDVGLANANLDGTSLASVNLQNASLQDATLTDANLAGAQLAGADVGGADFTGASLNEVSSGELTGNPLHLPAHWFLAGPNGYLLGPDANLQSANLAYASLAGADLIDADLTGADLIGTNLHVADLQGSDLEGADADQTDFDDANLTSATLQNAAIYEATMQQASLPSANLTGASVEYSNLQGANLNGATLTGITWTDTTCPDGSNSDSGNPHGCTAQLPAPLAVPTVATGTPGTDGWYTSQVVVDWNWIDPNASVTSCPASSTTSGLGAGVSVHATCADSNGVSGSAVYAVNVDTTRPAVSALGPRSGATYTVGRVPAARCLTTETISGVRKPAAAADVVSQGEEGVGLFVLTCSGARSLAGLEQRAPVRLTYAVASGFGGFSSPAPGGVLSKGKPVTVRFQLTAAGGRPLTTGAAAVLASAHVVQATLAGPGIKATTALCDWSASARSFQCAIKVPAAVRTGMTQRYTVTATENLGPGHVAVLTGKSANPEIIHFS